MNETLIITHNAGFFSCCSIRLLRIIEFVNKFGYLPNIIDSSQQFSKYKNSNVDLTTYYFEEKKELEPVRSCYFHCDAQFHKYNELEIHEISKYIDNYFTPSSFVKSIVSILETKYNIDYDNTCSVFYRGNDKSKETGIASYLDFFNQVDDVISKKPTVRFHVQTDETQFVEEFLKRYPNSFVFEETPHIQKSQTTVHDILPTSDRRLSAANFLAATIVVSKCKYIITHSGNCGIWSILYRGNTDNVYQYLDHKSDFIDYKGWIVS